MSTRRLPISALSVLSILGASLIAIPSVAQAATPKCKGKVATIVSSARVINGTNGADVIVVKGSGQHTINSGAGNDLICGSVGNDLINAGTGNDYIAGNSGIDKLAGGAGSDTISGGVGNDTITGGTGNDTISGGVGNDTARGEAGNDIVNGDSGSDSLNGGEGNDRIDGGTGNDSISGEAGADAISGGTGNDSISGGTGSDTIQGAIGADQLSGGSDSDAITGGAGDDALSGDAGADTINGGTGTNYCTTDGADLVTGACDTEVLNPSNPNPSDAPVAAVPDVFAGPVVRHCATDIADLLTPCAIDTADSAAGNKDVVSIVSAGSVLTFRWLVDGREAVDSSWVKIGGASGWVTSWCGFAISGRQGPVTSQGTVFTATCQIPQDAVNAEYTAFFDAGYVTGQNAQSTSAEFRVIGGSSDSTAPAVSQIALSSPTLAYDQILDITYTAQDETGVKGIVAWVALDGYGFANNQGRSYVDYKEFSILTTGDAKNGTYLQQIALNDYAPAGEYTIWISALDELGNKVFEQTDVKFRVN
jgi:Ca2+-binding RTX toxin-like protein